MKSSTCYPQVRTRFQTPLAHPYFPQFAPDAVKRNAVMNRPAANIERIEGAYKIQLAIPGVAKDQIKIEINDDQLIVTGLPVNSESKPKFVREEFDFGGFKRAFRLHKNADTTAMTAAFEQGILTIIIPDASPETIKINIQ